VGGGERREERKEEGVINYDGSFTSVIPFFVIRGRERRKGGRKRKKKERGKERSNEVQERRNSILIKFQTSLFFLHHRERSEREEGKKNRPAAHRIDPIFQLSIKGEKRKRGKKKRRRRRK